MTQEEKQLLLKDLCGMLPYELKGNFNGEIIDIISIGIRDAFNSVQIVKDTYTDRTSWENIDKIKPYLRPLSSMTEEEKDELYDWGWACEENNIYSDGSSDANNVYQNYQKDIQDIKWLIDWLLEHHFDFRGLIEKGLALEAPKGIYKTE